MIFKKQEFNFLDWYCFFANTKGELNNKLQIKGSKEKNEVMFALDTGVNILYTPIKKEVEEDFIYILPLVEFSSILKGVKDDVEIIIKDNALIFGKSKYEFPVLEYTTPPTQVEVYNDQIEKENISFFLNKLSFFSDMKDFTGEEEKNFNYVCSYSDYYTTSRFSPPLVLLYKREKANNIPNGFAITSFVSNFISSLKIDELGIKDFEDYYSFTINNTYFVVAKQDKCYLPDLTTEEQRQKFENKYKIVVDKSKIKEVLNRLKIVTKNNIDTRIYLSVSKGELTIESKDNGYAVEKFEVEYDNELENYYVILSAEWLSKIINSLSGEKIEINCEPMCKCLKILGDDKNKVFVYVRYKYDDELN